MDSKIYFNLQSSEHFTSIILTRIFSGPRLWLIKNCLLLASIFFVVYIITRGTEKILWPFALGGLPLVIIGTWIIFELFFNFLENKLQKLPPLIKLEQINPEEKINLANALDFRTALTFHKIINFSFLHRLEIDSNLILYFFLNYPETNFILSRSGISLKQLKSFLRSKFVSLKDSAVSQKNIIEILMLAIQESKKRNKDFIDPKSVLIVLSEKNPDFKEILFQKKMESDDIRSVVAWHDDIFEDVARKTEYWKPENTPRFEGFSSDWAIGWTINLNRFAIDIAKLIRYHQNPFGKVLGHDDELQEIERILSLEAKNNVLLVGEPGTGKTAVLFEFANRLFTGKTTPKLAHKHILDLKIGLILAEAKTKGQIEERLYQVFSEAHRAGNIILFLENIKSIVSDEGAGTVNASRILLQYLNSPRFQFIATASPAEYNKYIASNPELDNTFYKVFMKETDIPTTIKILQIYVPRFEYNKKVYTTYQALREITKLADRYIKYKPFPEKALKLLDETITYVHLKTKDFFVNPDHVDLVLSERLGIPLGEVRGGEKEKLLHLEEILHKRIIGQEEAIKAVSNAMRRARAGIRSSKKPIGVFLFLGPTGVGKTETSKALAEVYFGSEKRMARFDMSEFQNIESIHKFIGPPPGMPGADLGGMLTNEIRTNPFTVLLLDEIEKAHPNILNIFLQVFDEGRLTDSLGQTVDFTNTIIIATSNAGSELIRKSITERIAPEILREKLTNYLLENKIFSPEFLNRFDAVVHFTPLSPGQITKIASLMIEKLKERIHEKGITLTVENKAIKKLATLGYVPEFGARPMARIIQEKIENVIAKKMIAGVYRRGDTITIKEEDIENSESNDKSN